MLVTGSGRGIGAQIARTLAASKYSVIINYESNRDAAEHTLREVERAGARGITVRADVSKRDQAEQLIAEATKTFGRLDALVNNAGVIVRPGHWEQITDEAWDRTLDVNLKGTFNCIRAAAPTMRKHKRGRIVNITSTYGMMGAAPVVAYTAAKAGVIDLTHSFAKELAPHVTVNAVAPGNIDTEMTASAGREFVDWTIGQTPLKRLGTVEEVASAVEFLLSDRAAFITGQVLVVDGGHMLR